MFGRIITLSLLMVLGLFGQGIDINTGTKGTLNVNRGGTGGTTASQALTNLGGIGAATTDTLSNKTLTNPRINAILDVSNGSVVLQIQSTGSATEGLAFTPSVAGNPVEINTFGVGSNVDLKIDPKGTGILRMPIADEILYGDGTPGQFQRKAANGRMEWATIAGTGTVTSVALSGITGILSVSGSPVTTNGTFALSLDSQAQNSVFVGPSSGSGTPTFRTLVAGDIPSLATSKITSGVFAAARISTTVVNSRCLHIDGLGNIDVAAADCNTGGGGGVTSLNSQTGIVTIAPGTAGTDFAVAAGGGAITLNLPTASASSRGALSSGDWSTFNSKVNGPGVGTLTNNLAAWSDTTGTTLSTGFTVSEATAVNTIPIRSAAGDIYTNWFRGSAISVDAGFFVDNGPPAISARRGNDSFNTGNIVEYKRFDDTSALSAIDWDGNFTGRSATTLALSANPGNCAAGEAARGITADGTAENCFTPSGGSNSMALYNVKDAPYNATGDGVADDTAEVQAAITACQDSARGGIVYFPPGIYGISSGLVHGNGSTSGASTASTKAVCRFVGAGAGDDSVGVTSGNVSISVIKWIGSNPGSLTYMVTIDGPMVGWGMEHLKIWPNSNANVVGLDLRQISFSHISDVSVSESGGGTSGGAFAVKIWTQKSFSHFACYNTIENLRIRPYTNSVGSGMWVGGNSSIGTACSLSLTGGYYNRDNNYTSGTNTATYGVLLDSSDNFHAYSVHFSTTGGNGARNGCTIGASVSAASGTYPDSAHFYGVSSAGMCGTTGSGRPFVVIGGECGADGQGSCDYHNAFTGGGTKPISISGEADAAFKGVGEMGIRYLGTNPNYKTLIVNHASGGQNGAGNIYFQRAGVDIGRIASDYFDGLKLYVSDGSGSGTLHQAMYLRNDNIVELGTFNFSTMGSNNNGSYGYCNDCKVTDGSNNTCAASGSGAFAIRINSVWRCFNSQN